MTDKLLEKLNSEQREAVLNTEGPLLIQAGAGSGKTKTLVHRIAYIISQNLALPSNILAVTFTNKAAKEMRQRISILLGENSGNRHFMPFMGTFHSVCVKILRQDGENIGVPRNFIIYDELEKRSLIKKILKASRIDDKVYTPSSVASRISLSKNKMTRFDMASRGVSAGIDEVVLDIMPIYNDELKKYKALDFDDLIVKVVSLLERNPGIRKKWQDQFRYVMIDEYQDTNKAQYDLIKLLVGNDNIAVVGDDWQSIYSWRGANFQNILNFSRDYKNVKTIKLEQNYRSSQSILDAAHKIISKNKQRSSKKLWSDIKGHSPVQVLQASNQTTEADLVARNIDLSVKIGKRKFNDYAVLYRTNAQSRSIEDMFMRYGIPYKVVGGLRFYDRKEVKDIIAYIRFIYQPEDRISFDRIINTPRRGIGKKTEALFNKWIVDKGGILSALVSVGENSDIPSKARKELAELADVIISFRNVMDDITVAEFIERLIKRLGYLKFIDDGTAQGDARQENVKELLSVASSYQDVGLEDFLGEVSLISDTDDAQTNDLSNDNFVTLMTLHSAKGLEFTAVFIVGLEETILPHSRAMDSEPEMEEERRLLYVGMTRAMRELYLTYATSRALYGQVQYNPPSSFLSDIDAKVMTPEESSNDYSSQSYANTNELVYVIDIEKGDRVKHRVFGLGVIMDKNGEDVSVLFDKKGLRRLNLAFAPLEKVE